MLSNLCFLEQKIHQVQDIVRSMMSQAGQFPVRPNELAAQQQLVRADLTSIIIQLISTAGTLLPSMNSTLFSTNTSVGQLGCITGSPSGLVGLNDNAQQNQGFLSQGTKGSEGEEHIDGMTGYVAEVTDPTPDEEHDGKNTEDGTDCENLLPGSYEILQLEKEEILAPHTHFCLLCGKGFKRDANLRMHRRGHGDEYKSPSTLARPSKEPNSESVLIKRYSCLSVGCKQNKEHRKFQPLKTILCVKNHYKRSQSDKHYTCGKCSARNFLSLQTSRLMRSIVAGTSGCVLVGQLSQGRTSYSAMLLCSKVTLQLFSLKKLNGQEFCIMGKAAKQCLAWETAGFNFGGSDIDDVGVLDVKVLDDNESYFSPMGFDSCNFGGLNMLPQEAFRPSESSFPFS